MLILKLNSYTVARMTLKSRGKNNVTVSLVFCQYFLTLITLEVKPIVLSTWNPNHWHFDYIFCWFTDNDI